MNKIRTAVVFGGRSPEYDVSLMSSYSIINAIDREKYDVILIGVTRLGGWYRYTGDVEGIRDDKWHLDETFLKRVILSPSYGEGLLELDNGRVTQVPVDVVFPVLHGRYGEDGTVQGLCELAGIPVVGSGAAASALCMDKDRAHKLISLCGIRVPRSICFEYKPSESELASAAKELNLPVVVKPVKAGSSFGITVARELSQLNEAVGLAFGYDDAVIIEEKIHGFETGCAVVGNTELTVGRIDEIELSGEFFDFEEKYTLKTSKIHVPARVSAETEERLQNTAKTIYRALGCRGYARIDIFLTDNNEIVFNEANTIPGFTEHSRFPSMMKAAGVSFSMLVDMLISMSIDHRE